MTGEEREFLKANRLVIVGMNRKAGPPHLTPVYCVLDGDDLLMSTTASRLKAKAVWRNPDVSLCVIGEQPPCPYLLIYGKGTIEQEGAVGAMMQVGARMTGNPVPESARPALEERARSEGRVVLRVRPESIRGSLPRSG